MPTIPAGVQTKDLAVQASQTAMSALAGGYNPPAGQEEKRNQSQKQLYTKWATYFQRPFGPNAPLVPRYGADQIQATPRQAQYPVGVNIRYFPRGDYGLTPFDQLWNLASVYDIASMCIASRIETILGATWDFVAKDKKKQTDLEDEIEFAETFWEFPDRINDYASWISMFVWDMFAIDAPTIFPRQNRGGDLYSLDLVDGSMIKPLLDDRGRTLAYQQIVWGYPMSDYQRAFSSENKEFPTYSTEELIYRPRWPRIRIPYGFPPTEQVILRTNTALRKQTHDLAWYSEGNIPDMLAWPPEGMLNPEEVKKFEDWFNALLEGNDSARRKMRFLPWQANVKELKPYSYDTKLDYLLLEITCAAFGVSKQELGFTEGANRASAQFQENLTHRRSFLPLAIWLKNLFDKITAKRLAPASIRKAVQNAQATWYKGSPTKITKNPFSQIEWQWHAGEREDNLMTAQMDKIYIEAAVVSAEEVRSLRFGDVLEGAAPSQPPVKQPAFGGKGVTPPNTRTSMPETSARIPGGAQTKSPRYSGPC